MTRKRFAWILIYLSLPLWIAVGILAFAFGEWDMVKIIVGCNVALLLTSHFLFTRPKRRQEDEG